MKKFLALLIVALMLTVSLASCNLDWLTPETPTTPTSPTQTEPKPDPQPEPAHECEHACESCGKCLDAECAETVCASKCPGHYVLTLGETTVKVDGGAVIGEIPAVPAEVGKTGKWMVGDVEITAETVYNWTENKTAEAVYADIYYTVTYTANGEVRETISVKHGATAAYPGEQTEGGYHVSGWMLDGESYDFATPVTADINLVAVVVPNTYKLTLGENEVSVTYGQAVGTLPEVDAVTGKTGKWMVGEVEITAETVWSWTENKTATAEYTAITYYVTFMADGNQVGERLPYTVDNASVTAPEVPAKTGYTGAWADYTLTTGDVTVNAEYTLVTYYVTFMADGEQVGEALAYTVENKNVTAPAVPEKEGYDGAWADYTLTTGDVIVNAVYTIKTYTVTFVAAGQTQGTLTVEHGSAVAEPETVVVGAYYVSGWTLNGEAYDFSTAVTTNLELVATLALWDPSYGTQKSEFAYYISNFDNASVMLGITETAWDNPWFNDPYAPMTEKGTVAQGSYSLVNGKVTGLQFEQQESGYTGFSYKLPSALDLSKVETIAVRVAYGSWNAHYANFYILVKSGENMVNAINFAKQYNTYNTSFAGLTAETLAPDADGKVYTLNVNFRECWVEIDVAALMEATGFTTIDEIYFGQDNTGFKLVIDEIYYTVHHEEVKSLTVDFSTSNTSGGSATLTDTTDGALAFTGAAWFAGGAKYSLSEGVTISEIDTMTFRFKRSGGESAIIYINSTNNDAHYLNLHGDTSAYQVSSSTDDDGYTILTIDFAKFVEAKGMTDTTLTSFTLTCNNASGVVTFDYITINLK